MVNGLFKSFSLILICAVYFCGTTDVNAAMYKCADADGNISYSQLPCANTQQSKQLSKSRVRKTTDAVCGEVRQFALKVARAMRNGVEVSETIDRHGGLDLISKGALGIVNYVYSYRVNKNVSSAKIGSLSVIKCNNGAFGRLEYADIPGAIDPESEEAMQLRLLEAQSGGNFTGTANEMAEPPQRKPQSTPRSGNYSKKTTDSQNAHASRNCERYKNSLKRLDERMRSGYNAAEYDDLRAKRKEYRRLIKQWCNK